MYDAPHDASLTNDHSHVRFKDARRWPHRCLYAIPTPDAGFLTTSSRPLTPPDVNRDTSAPAGRQGSVAKVDDRREFTRAADLYTQPGGEDILIARIAAGLPADYHPQRPAVPGGQAAPLVADAGHGVQLSVRRLGDGWVVATARTHCTAPARQPDTAAVASAGTPTGALSTVSGILAALGASVGQMHSQTLPCPSGGSLVTITAISERTNSGDLAKRLASHLPPSRGPTPPPRIGSLTAPGPSPSSWPLPTTPPP
jgi:hypothetical protein